MQNLKKIKLIKTYKGNCKHPDFLKIKYKIYGKDKFKPESYEYHYLKKTTLNCK